MSGGNLGFLDGFFGKKPVQPSGKLYLSQKQNRSYMVDDDEEEKLDLRQSQASLLRQSHATLNITRSYTEQVKRLQFILTSPSHIFSNLERQEVSAMVFEGEGIPDEMRGMYWQKCSGLLAYK